MEIKPDPKNARRHSDRNKKLIRQSLEQVGPARGILLDADGIIRAGNGVYEQAQALSIPVQVVPSDGKSLIAVQRTDLRGKDAIRAAALDNLTADSSSYDYDADILAQIAKDDEVIAAIAKEDARLREILKQEAKPESAGLGVKVYSDEQIIDSAFEYFRKAGFPYRNLPVHVSMQDINKLATCDPAALIHSDAAYQVADTYHPHRFDTFVVGMCSQREAFEDDKKLRKALCLDLQYSGQVGLSAINKLQIVNGTQPASNFRPGFACYLYRRFCQEGATVLDTSTGYGGRLIGFIASGVAGKYIGIDPNTLTHQGNLRMAQELGFSDKVELHNLPAEDVPTDTVRGRCDFAFTSPPYFSKEHYSDEPTQSWVRYKTGDEWRNGFLVPMLRLQYEALRPDCYAIVNIADVKIKGQTYPLVDWTIDAAKQVGFEHERTERFELSRRFGAGMKDEVASEPVLVFRKT